MRRIALATAIILQSSSSCFALPKSSDWPDCDTGAPEQQIGSCGKILAKGGEVSAALAWVYYRRGNGYQDTGRPKEALADYAKAYELNPQFSKPHNASGTVHFDHGGVEILRQSIGARFVFGIGRARFDQG